ncbi:DUF2793 domain-containing protein [Cereibacter sphaeroides]|nr:DUF2793 domain-containing protein [Cereibacter sphaeroides]
MDETSTNLNLPYLQAAQAQKHVTHNAALEQLDLIVQLTLQSFAEATPPLAPADGQVWAVATGGTGAFAGHDGELAAWSNGGWLFLTPKPGWRGVVGTELRLWNGSAFVTPDLPALQNLPGVGIGTTHDATNKLAVASDAVLLSHAGAGHQLKVNKNAASDTASLLFQTGWSGRAEMGTLGSDAFGVKVSADGSSWTAALSVNGATGVPTMGQGAVINGLLTGTSVVQSDSDVTTGRVLTTGAGAVQAYRQGNILGTVSQSGGGPTGAIMERGSNANGEYVRFADGTQICWASIDETPTAWATAEGAFFRRSSSLTWTYPAAFIAAPVVTPTAHFGDERVTGCRPRGIPGTMSVFLTPWSSSSSGAANAKTVFAVAYGRWF